MTLRRLLVVSHVCHYEHDGAIHAYGPYAREIDIWADLFPELEIASPVRREPPPREALRLDRANVRLRPMPETGGSTVGAKLWQLLCLPAIVVTMARAMLAADAVHVRCPGNLGLVGVVLAPLLRRRRVAKFAGQWNGYVNEPWTGRLQRFLLRTWWDAPVLVYGVWPDQPAHIVPFFTSMMSGDQVATAVGAAEQKVIAGPLRVLFSGRLAPEKRVHALLDAVRLVVDRGVAVEVVIAGDGPERERLENQIAGLGLDDIVTFTGPLPFAEGLTWYRWAHCLVLPSEHSEGWPKVVAEAMCHGVLCVAVDHGQIRAMLDDRGVVLSTGSAPAIADALTAIAADPSRFEPIALEASRWARQYSLEGLRAALAGLLSQRWRTGISMVEQRR
ncbi:MAG: glycosyltransferase family 4 protein [Vicinamibacterales bacterium]